MKIRLFLTRTKIKVQKPKSKSLIHNFLVSAVCLLSVHPAQRMQHRSSASTASIEFLRTTGGATRVIIYAGPTKGALAKKRMNKLSNPTRVAFISSLFLLFALTPARLFAQATTAEQPAPNNVRPTVLTRSATTSQPNAQPATITPNATLPATPDIAPPAPVIITQGLLVETLDGKVV